MEGDTPYRQLADRLNALPNGFPPTPDGAELKLLAKLYTPEEASLAAQLRLTLETPEQLAARLDQQVDVLRLMLKSMARRGLIAAGRANSGLGYGLMPFVVGVYEMQVGRMDAELAALFEDYYQRAFGEALAIQPQFHRVIPVHQSVKSGMEVHPYESVAAIIDRMQSWAVFDCICRTQKALLGDPCHHPVEVCMMMNEKPGVYDQSTQVKALNRDEALETLKRAAASGLVHSVSNNQQGVWYICNCCTCSCAILRGMAELGMANVVARSSFVNRVDTSLCMSCGDCAPACQFGAITVGDVAVVDEYRCVGCGVCVVACSEGALHLESRPADQITPPPLDEVAWLQDRAKNRHLDLDQVL